MEARHDTPVVTARDIRQFQADKRAANKRLNAELWHRASQDADAIVKMIIAQFAPRTIYQWGSVLDGETFTDISDIDIAVEGLGAAERYFALLAAAEPMTRFPLDLVELEHVEPEYAALIRKYGRCVYRRTQGGD